MGRTVTPIYSSPSSQTSHAECCIPVTNDPAAAVPVGTDRNPTAAAVAITLVGITFAARWPSLGESFWVDELHTAWCVVGPWGEVAGRAAAGNQSPVYFAVTKAWAAVFGTSEVAMRMTSVLAVATAAVALFVAVVRRTGSVAGGAAAGAWVALESNAVFFGTELRPYALVIAAAAGVLAAGRHAGWSAAAAAVGAAASPTALISLGVLWAASCRPTGRRWGWAALPVAAAAVGVVGLMTAWDGRGSWAAFATFRWQSLATLWPWVTLVGGPVVVAAVRRRSVAPEFWWWIGSVVVVLAVHAGLSTVAGVHLWHRRYLVATLPVLAGAFGIAVASLPRRWAWVAMAAVIVGLGGTWQPVRRGENWRGVAAWLRANVDAGETIRLDPGLIEMSRPDAADRQAYLRYPLTGVYQIDSPIEVRRYDGRAWDGVWVVRRRGVVVIDGRE